MNFPSRSMRWKRARSFRNEIVGSTATIIATIFRENQMLIPSALAGLLLGAILSDTMNFHSPTTTDRDRSTANILAALADLDMEEFAEELFTVTASQEKVSFPDMINPSAKETRTDAQEIAGALERFCRKKQIDLAVLVFTSILENGSVVYAGGDRSSWAAEAFPDRGGEEHTFQENLLSRKQQILPALSQVISDYMGG